MLVQIINYLIPLDILSELDGPIKGTIWHCVLVSCSSLVLLAYTENIHFYC